MSLYKSVLPENVINMKGQVSVEMLILIAVVIAVVALAATYLMSTMEHTGKHIEEQSNELLERTSIGKKGPGETCYSDEICESNECTENTCE